MSAPKTPARRIPGAEAAKLRGRIAAAKWLILRRIAQIVFLAVFLTGPLAGLWIAKGTLASSLTLNILPLSDPFIVLQSLLARHMPETALLLGALIVLATYALVGGRMYCSWVCPINPVADLARWLRMRLGLKEGMAIDRRLRLWIMGAVLVASAASGAVVWELVNPITILHRELAFGTLFAGGIAWTAVAGVFLFDLAVSNRGWCGHLCPVGAFYGLLGAKSLLRVRADRREACDDCMDCFTVCPEPQVIAPALKGAARGIGPVILSRDCTNCGRCIDVCHRLVFSFGLRGPNRTAAPEGASQHRPESRRAA